MENVFTEFNDRFAKPLCIVLTVAMFLAKAAHTFSWQSTEQKHADGICSQIEACESIKVQDTRSMNDQRHLQAVWVASLKDSDSISHKEEVGKNIIIANRQNQSVFMETLFQSAPARVFVR